MALAVNMPAQTQDLFKSKTIKANMVKVADWQLKNPKHPLYDWTNGAFFAGVFAAYETTGSKEIMAAPVAVEPA